MTSFHPIYTTTTLLLPRNRATPRVFDVVYHQLAVISLCTKFERRSVASLVCRHWLAVHSGFLSAYVILTQWIHPRRYYT